ncbi:hypothetical protein [Brotaphodocola sp.]|uniref:hypothetical protein n=1 Tax=Brotaphodocola sp. TaxID=3073577 RepID=UPI003D7D4C9E
MKNNKKRFFMLVLTVILAISTQFTSLAYAGETQGIDKIEVLTSTRGRLISSVNVRISDEGKGVIGAYAELLCHEPMEELRIWVYLEHQTSAGSWSTVSYKKFEWLAEDYPNEDLSMAIVSYNIPNMKRGEKYRLKCLFGADHADLGSENWRASTSALYLE